MSCLSVRWGIFVPTVFITLFTSVLPATAQTTYTWTGQDFDDNWFSPLNWSAAGPGSPPPLNNINNTFVVLSGNTRTTNVLDYSFSANSLTFSAGSGAFTVSTTTAETLTLGVGGLTVASGNTNNQTFNANLALGADQTWTNNGTGTLAIGGGIDTGGFLLTVGGGADSSFGGVISGAGSLAKSGTGTLTVSSGNTFTGTVRISGGTLGIAADSALGAAPGAATPAKLTLDGGTLSIATGFTLNANRGIALGPTSGTGNGTVLVASGQTLTYAGVIANNGGTGVLVKTGAGTLVLSGNSTFTGGVVLNGGVLQVPSVSTNTAGAAERLGAVPSSLDPDAVTISNGAVLRNTQTGTAGSSFVTANRGITLGAGGGVFDLPDTASGTFLVYAGVVAQGANPLTKTGAAILALSGTTTGTGALNINQGMVRLRASSNRISDSTPVTIAAGAALDMATFSDTIGSLAGAGNVAFAGTGTLTVGGINSSTTFSGAISGAGSLSKTGSGIFTLTGANTHTGATNISGGTLALGGGGSLAAGSAVSVNNNGTLAGTGTVNGTVTVNQGGTLAPGIAGSGVLILGGNTVIHTSGVNGPGRLAISAAAPGTNSGLAIQGAATTLDFKSGSVLELSLLGGFGAAGSYTLVTMPSGSGANVLVDAIPTTDGQLLGTFVQGSGATGPVLIAPSGFALAAGDTFALSRTGDTVLLTFTPVPEPARVLGLAAGALAFGWTILRRRHGRFTLAESPHRVLPSTTTASSST